MLRSVCLTALCLVSFACSQDPSQGIAYVPPDFSAIGSPSLHSDGVKGGGRLKIAYLTFEGAQLPQGFIDTQLGNLWCEATRTQDGALRCLPRESGTFKNFFLDDLCKNPIWGAVGAIPPFAVVPKPAGAVVYNTAAIPPPAPTMVFVSNGQSCVASALTGYENSGLFTLGAVVPPETFALLKLEAGP